MKHSELHLLTLSQTSSCLLLTPFVSIIVQVLNTFSLWGPHEAPIRLFSETKNINDLKFCKTANY